jgi:molybdopterin-guanine dinucleotide biosynthesis protein B
MKCIAFAGASRLREGRFFDDLIAALRIDGHTVAAMKRAPDGFDIDRPGTWSQQRREAGCAEVMLVGGRRFALLHEFDAGAVPDVDTLLARLAPVDIVLLEGFRAAAVPTIEAIDASAARPPRWPNDPSIVALVSDAPVDSPLPRFAPTEVAALAAFIGAL